MCCVGVLSELSIVGWEGGNTAADGGEAGAGDAGYAGRTKIRETLAYKYAV